jgi:NAD+ diphosphatase
MQVRICGTNLVCPDEGWSWPDAENEEGDVAFLSPSGQVWSVRTLESTTSQDRLLPIRTALAEARDEQSSVLLRAVPLAHWRATNRYCGRCGKTTQRRVEGFVLVCPACGQEFWPRLTPAIIVLVHRGNKILLARHKRSAQGFFSCLAGFVEAGETLEQTVQREIMEEVGLKIDAPVYKSSQSWPFPSTLMLAFRANAPTGEPVPDGNEILEARWFGRDELPALPPPFSVARRLIEDFFKELE